jgi:hypothetical protein
VIKPEPRVIKAMGMFVRQHPDFLEWLEGVYNRELEALPSVIINVGIAQGRCQALGDIVKLMKDAPSIAAKLQ